jgi:hypothetical protein
MAGGVVEVFNITQYPITSLTVNAGSAIATPVPGVEFGGTPSFVSVAQGSGTGLFGPSNSVSVYFDGQLGWTQSVTLPQGPPNASYYLWIAFNGYFLSDATGNVRGFAWQRPFLVVRGTDEGIEVDTGTSVRK